MEDRGTFKTTGNNKGETNWFGLYFIFYKFSNNSIYL